MLVSSGECCAEDCDAALDAMAAGDPDLDPIWGLLANSGVDCDGAESSNDAGSACGTHGIASGVHIGKALADSGCVPDVSTSSSTEADEATTEAPSSGLMSPRAVDAAEVVDVKKAISNVVAKEEVSSDRFELPPDEPVTVSRWEVKGCDAYVLDGVLSQAECDLLIRQGDGHWSFWDNADCPRVAFRNAHTIEVTHHDLAARIWSRIAHLVNQSVCIGDTEEEDPRSEVDIVGTWSAYAVNPTLLLSRYLNGGHFSPHTDGTTVVDFNRRTFYSCVLFLNDSPWGGSTRIYSDAQIGKELVKDNEGRLTGDTSLILDTVPPAPGRMLVFYHRLMHEGVPAAEKYIIRTDVLYHRGPEICTAPEDVEAFRMYERAQFLAEHSDCEGACKLFERCFKLSPALAKVYKM